ncbi:MAG: N-formylglutamate amidohydrolase [Deltaproteobacteria bacterium]|nr:N-formylglutamate amidohydrolase [Deltaproteobacteria bacterium]
MPSVRSRLVLSCEHASAHVPREFAGLFRGERAILATHRGYDAGVLDVSRGLARRLAAPLIAGATTRLLVDLNRSPHNPAVYSRFTRDLPLPARRALIARFHAPHWARVERAVTQAARPVVHIAVHSFTPVLGDDVRDFELGLLYDPQRPRERRFADLLRAGLAARAPEVRVRRNAPYRGTSDGLPTAIRRKRRPGDYLGLEIELNQAVLGSRRERLAWVARLAPVLREALSRTS